MSQRITSSDIARAASVSQTTVSFVLNNTAGVSISPPTRARVLRAARALGYVPNSAARTLVSGRTRTLGLVLSQGDLMRFDAFAPLLMAAISRVCNDQGYKLLVEAVAPGSKKDAYFDLTRSKSIDALIVLNPRAADEALVRLVESGFPVILLGSIGHRDENSICPNIRKAAENATQHLIGLGHRKIAHITYASLEYVGSRARLEAYRRALEAAKIPHDDKFVAYGDFSLESGRRAMKEILRRGKVPTALFAGNDTIAIGALLALREAGLSVPEKFAVVGFDDLPIAAYTNPRLTSVATQAAVHGEQAALAAIALLDGQKIGHRDCNLGLELIVRESCGAAVQFISSVKGTLLRRASQKR